MYHSKLTIIDISFQMFYVYCNICMENRFCPSMYGYCVVCYRVKAALYVRSVGHVFAYIYILDDDSEHKMDYETTLHPKVFPLITKRLYLKERLHININHIKLDSE